LEPNRALAATRYSVSLRVLPKIPNIVSGCEE
jgi:hypothetical protein